MIEYGEPFLDIKRKKKKSKAPYKYVEHRTFYPKQEEHREYKDRPQEVKDSIKQAVINHTAKVRKGKTSNHRRQHARLKRQGLRARHKALGNLKTCTHCLEEKAITDFDLQKDATHPQHQRRPYCYVCRKEKNRLYYLKRKENVS